MKKLLILLSIIAIVVVLLAAGVFGYSKYREVQLKQENLQTQLEEKSSNEQNNENNENVQQEQSYNNNENQSSENNQKEDNNNEQKVTRENVFDYAIAAINENGDADLMKFQEPSYSDGVWTIDANNKSGVGSNMIKVYDDRWVQIYNGAGDVIQETQIELQ